jgi:hypothetical protein
LSSINNCLAVPVKADAYTKEFPLGDHIGDSSTERLKVLLSVSPVLRLSNHTSALPNDRPVIPIWFPEGEMLILPHPCPILSRVVMGIESLFIKFPDRSTTFRTFKMPIFRGRNIRLPVSDTEINAAPLHVAVLTPDNTATGSPLIFNPRRSNGTIKIVPSLLAKRRLPLER